MAFRCSLRTTGRPKTFSVVAYDASKPDKHYIRRIVDVDKKRDLILNIPISPRRLVFEVRDITNGEFVKGQSVAEIVPDKLRTVPLVTDELTKDFLDWFLGFIERSDNLPDGTYKDPTGKFVIKLMSDLKNEYGESIGTPARIHKTQDFIEINSKHFKNETVPGKVAIGLHEYSHNFLNYNMDSEEEADYNGVRMYLSQGFPVMELIESYTGFLGDSEQTRNRISVIDNFIKKHNLENYADLYQLNSKPQPLEFNGFSDIIWGMKTKRDWLTI